MTYDVTLNFTHSLTHSFSEIFGEQLNIFYFQNWTPSNLSLVALAVVCIT